MKIVKKILYYVLLLVFSMTFVYSGLHVYEYWKESQDSKQVTEGLIQQAVTQRPAKVVPEDVDEPEVETAPILVDFDTLHQQSEDIVAWLYCPEITLDYPVAQSGDNEYYLRRLLNGKWNVGGTIFQDYRCPDDYSAWHTIIYGHHMKNGTMFGSLQNYQDQAYYDANPVIYLLAPEKDFKVELIAGFVSDADGEIYTLPQTQEEKAALVDYCLSQSDFQSTAEIQPEDKLLTLSTCSYVYDNARYVVVGVLRELARDSE